MKETIDKVDLFWTGGWDSSFRLIQLLLTTESQVQPHYIIRHEDSTGTEITTMIKIRRAIVRDFPEVRSRFLQTVYTNEDLISRYDDIEEQVKELSTQVRVNDQYRIMSNYCRELSIDRIEVSLDKTPGETAQEWLEKHFKGIPAFSCFSYPIFDLTKADMLDIARTNGWEEILKMTSFCRRPPKIKPCGPCGPCTDAVISGMGFRLPFKSRMKAKLLIPLRKYWRNNYDKNKGTKLFRLIERRFVGRL